MSSSRDAHHIESIPARRRGLYQGTRSWRAEISTKKERGFSRCPWLSPFATPILHAPLPALVPSSSTSSISSKRNLLQSDRSAGLFVRVLYDYRAQGKFRLHEFVVMPDHVHLLLTIGCDLTIERAMQFIKGGFAFRAGRELGFRAPVWQKGFSEIRVLDVNAFQRVGEYIRKNPVRRNLVSEASEFPHSSACVGIELDPMPQGLKPVDFVRFGGIAKAMP